jgi:5-bromo-4-chloroindolyl phosphate hydrolysis protein
MQNGWIVLPLMFAIMFFVTGIIISILFFPNSIISSDVLTVDSALIGGEYLVNAVGGQYLHDVAQSKRAALEVNDLENERFRFDVDYIEEMHPSIRTLDHMYKASTALNAKFR